MAKTPDRRAADHSPRRAFVQAAAPLQILAGVLNAAALAALLFWTFGIIQSAGARDISLVEICLLAFLMLMLGTSSILFFALGRHGLKFEDLDGELHFDKLTGTLNRAGFEEALTREVRSAGRYHYPLTLCLVEIDHFSSLQQNFGAEKGNELLKNFGVFLRGSIRFTDHAAHISGEEFLVLLPHTDLIQSEKFLARLLMLSEERVDCTFSAGVTAFRAGETEDGFLQRARLALDQAKREGAKRIRCVIGHDDSHVILSF